MIRRMTDNDIVAVREVALASWKETYASLFPVEVQEDWFERTYSAAMLSKQLEKTLMYVIEDQQIVCGFVSFTKVDEDGDSELTALYIMPSKMNLGFGTKLVAHGLEELRATGEQLHVYVESTNEIARAFYEKIGFQLVDEFEEYFEGHQVTTAQYQYPLKTPTFS
ncbi:GNAT family N-acetyltransferase [Chryseomicrobium palamuruense]|uniref:GNAT family N-acetyltransferase n=1 Tax=Chryseomicrobium palamuruense TaxID=682973 RepID=A0ABV8UWI5_9BACL